ncbi:putative transcriptional factor [Mycobacterium phage PP]|uniref:Putative transcriptional factor n=1 Tax=Mycobacterium phage PP TaxID=2077134 RepID=A0A2Z5XVD0_9CAUD|nr:putative transcriptional factor [Mycobacterium phage PP]BBC53806.1 putative transcriptional factor [Mycobacterium phage PP]
MAITHPTHVDQRVRDIETGRIGTVTRVLGVQDSRVLPDPQRLLLVTWDDTGSKVSVWSDQLSTN